MPYFPERPLIVQNDFTVLLECRHPDFEKVRATLARFADLIKSPEQIHTYRITPMSLWNAAAAHMDYGAVIECLDTYSKFEIPRRLRQDIKQLMRRYGLLRLVRQGERLLLLSDDEKVIGELFGMPSLQFFWKERIDGQMIEVHPAYRGTLKQQLLRLGYPVQDLAGYHQGEPLPVALRRVARCGQPFALRDYQHKAVEAFYQEGSGVIVLPCGAGKTIVGIAAMSKLNCATLILTTNVTSVRQWKQEILDKTNLSEEAVGEYNGTRKEVRPVTIATYQILTHRRTKADEFSQMRLFNERDWGLIIYDEVHLLPAPVFRMTADIQATRRLGLTATLIREDGREEEVFSLIGPKRFDVSWRELETGGWIAKADCTELRIPLPAPLRERYRLAEARQRFRLAGENPAKLEVIRQLLGKHRGEPTLIIGHYLNQLRKIADLTGAPLITGELPYDERERLYAQFKQGAVPLLIVSKVANFAVDLPDASVAIQVSGSYGSRQEEAQRLGRILRAKSGGNRAFFYSLVSAETKEQDFALHRQLFLVEQGYSYRIETLGDSETGSSQGALERGAGTR